MHRRRNFRARSDGGLTYLPPPPPPRAPPDRGKHLWRVRVRARVRACVRRVHAAREPRLNGEVVLIDVVPLGCVKAGGTARYERSRMYVDVPVPLKMWIMAWLCHQYATKPTVCARAERSARSTGWWVLLN